MDKRFQIGSRVIVKSGGVAGRPESGGHTATIVKLWSKEIWVIAMDEVSSNGKPIFFLADEADLIYTAMTERDAVIALRAQERMHRRAAAVNTKLASDHLQAADRLRAAISKAGARDVPHMPVEARHG